MRSNEYAQDNAGNFPNYVDGSNPDKSARIPNAYTKQQGRKLTAGSCVSSSRNNFDGNPCFFRHLKECLIKEISVILIGIDALVP